MKKIKEFVDPIVKYPNSVLTEVCRPIEKVTDEVKAFVQTLLIICKHYDAYGIAAPQVGKKVRVIVINSDKCPSVEVFGYDPGDSSSEPVKKKYMRKRHCYLINPVIENLGTTQHKFKEGCLSLPNVHGWVSRPSSLSVTFQGVDGKTYREDISDTSKDVYGIIVQHEVDHLDGVLMMDRMDQFNRMKVADKVNKLRSRK